MSLKLILGFIFSGLAVLDFVGFLELSKSNNFNLSVITCILFGIFTFFAGWCLKDELTGN